MESLRSVPRKRALVLVQCSHLLRGCYLLKKCGDFSHTRSKREFQWEQDLPISVAHEARMTCRRTSSTHACSVDLWMLPHIYPTKSHVPHLLGSTVQKREEGPACG